MRYSILLILLMISPFFIPSDTAVIVPHKGDTVLEASKGSMILPYPIIYNTAQYIGDIDGDNRSDMVIPYPDLINGTGTIALYPSRSNHSGIFITSRISGSDFGRLVIADGDINGDGMSELMVLNGSGYLHIYRGRTIWNNMSEEDVDLLILNCSSKPAVIDLNGDDRDDIVTYSNGSMFIHYGPDIKSPPLEMPFDEVPDLITKGDIDGDGVRELIILSSSSGVSSISIYDDDMEKPQIESSFGFNISSLSTGDRNGDGRDDLIVHIPEHPSFGAISTLLSPIDAGVINLSDVESSILGDMDDPLNGSINWIMEDMDGDGLKDIFISNPDHDGGRGKLYSFFSDTGISGDVGIDDRDSYVVGDLPDGSLGTFISVSGDSDGDLLSEVYISSGTELFMLNLTENIPPGEGEGLGFFARESSHGGPYIQDGEDLAIWLRVEDRSSKTKDIARIMVSNGDMTTYKLLEETSRSSGLFLGEIKLGNGSLPDESIYSLSNDTIEITYGDLKESISVIGSIWMDDPPVFTDVAVGPLAAHVDEPFEMGISGLDPDGGEVTLYAEEIPGWLTLDGWMLIGTPTEDDQGSGEIVLNLSDGMDTTELRSGYSVTMPIPSIELPDVPYETIEGMEFRFDMEISGIVSDTRMEFNSTGPQDLSWMTFHTKGFIDGTPANRDVGIWSLNLTITNPGNITERASWSIEVINAKPDITAPTDANTDIYETLSIDIRSTYEGDGLTFYSVEGPDGVSIAPVSGLLSWSPNASHTGTHYVTVSVFDGHGEMNSSVIIIHVMDPPLDLLTYLPGEIPSHRFFSLSINSTGKEAVNHTYEGLPYWLVLDRVNNTVSGIPWNLDSGDHQVTIIISDSTKRIRRIKWNLSVIPDNRMRDPSIAITSYNLKDGKLDVIFSILNLTRSINSITLTLTDQDGLRITLPRSNGSTEPFTLDIRDFNGPITAYLEAEIDGRNINTAITIHEIHGDGREDPSFPWLIIPIFLIIIISLVVILLSVERTSYTIQKYIFGGGEVREKDLISIIQHQPGIRYREISHEVSLTRREIFATLAHLEDSADIRTMIVGKCVRFYPTVGSFVDGRLVLNRHEIRIIRELLDVRSITEDRLLEETGLSLQKLRRYAGVLDLKGIVTITISVKDRRYSLSKNQKVRVRMYMGGPDN